MSKSGVADTYVRIVQYMYDGSTIAVRCAVGMYVCMYKLYFPTVKT